MKSHKPVPGLAMTEEVLFNVLGWRSARGVVMLWGMFDESYEHDRNTGHAVRVTMGGCIASYDAWEAFSAEWSAALQAAGVAMFHMADFEANRQEFDGWNKDAAARRRRQNFLSNLLDILTRHVTVYIGVSNEVAIVDGSTRDEYRKSVIDVFSQLSRDQRNIQNDRFSVVFARHKDFNMERALAYVAIAESLEPIFGSISLDDPMMMCPLQAADIVAYELSRIQRPNAPQERYPFRRLRDAAREAGGTFSLTWR